jgi:hypothetical protein
MIALLLSCESFMGMQLQALLESLALHSWLQLTAFHSSQNTFHSKHSWWQG